MGTNLHKMVSNYDKDSKKKSIESYNSKLKFVMKSGSYNLGYKTTIDSLRRGNCKLVIIAKNCPPVRKAELSYYTMLSKTPLHFYNGNSIDLATVCGKYFHISCLSITNPGGSDIIQQA